MTSNLQLDYYQEGIIRGDRVILGRAITLVESTREEDQQLANELLQRLLTHTGGAIRVGISGVPGVGKSTFIEVLGNQLTEAGNKVAVLAIDPSSNRSKGSILGDKTRMESLSRNPNAWIRPTAAGSHLGGVAGRTREVSLLCEAAGFNVILIETVGVGQSETAVRDMTDFFLLLLLPGAGDELQGIKRGIVEMADAIAINKADGANLDAVAKAKTEITQALHYAPAATWGWQTKVLTMSALEKRGVDKVWQTIEDFMAKAKQMNVLDAARQEQRRKWMNESLQDLIRQYWLSKVDSAFWSSWEEKVAQQTVVAPLAAQAIFQDLEKKMTGRTE